MREGLQKLAALRAAFIKLFKILDRGALSAPPHQWWVKEYIQAITAVYTDLTLARFPYFATFASGGGGVRPPWRLETKRRRA